MSNQLPVLLRMVRGEPEPEPAGEQPSPGHEAAPESFSPRPVIDLLPGSQMTFSDQARAALAHACRAARLRAREQSRREGGLLHGIYTGQAGSLHDLDEYRRSRAWVPEALRVPPPDDPDDPGGYRPRASFAERENAAYLATAGRAGVALGQWIAWTAERQFRFWVTVLITLILTAAVAAWIVF